MPNANAPAPSTRSSISGPRSITSAADEGAEEEEGVRRALTEPSHQVRVPLGPVRRRDEHLVAARGERQLQLRPHAVEHLELEPVLRDGMLLRKPDRVLDDRLVV